MQMEKRLDRTVSCLAAELFGWLVGWLVGFEVLVDVYGRMHNDIYSGPKRDVSRLK